MNWYLRTLSWLLPVPQRYVWVREWHAELWHVRRECGWRAAAEMLPGAWADVQGLRAASQTKHTTKRWAWMWLMTRLLVLPLTLCAVALVAALTVPASRELLLSHSYDGPGGIVLLEDASGQAMNYSTFREWSWKRQFLFREFAFYTVKVRSVNHQRLRVAYATPNLLTMLGMTETAREGVYLTAKTAEALGNPKNIKLTLQELPVQGVLPRTTLTLWDDPQVVVLTREISANAQGHILGWANRGAGIDFGFAALRNGGPPMRVQVTSLSTQVVTPRISFLFALVLALCALPATRPLVWQDGLGLPQGWRPRLLLTVQIALLLAGSYLASMTVSTLVAAGQDTVETLVASALLLPGLRLVLCEHRHRCPCCLRKLKHPARVGQPSAAFLNWYGTELLCIRGHGLMHIPDLPTTWFPSPRWTPLDASWAPLFSR